MDAPTVSIVLPCYNGARYIEGSLRRLRGFLDAHGSVLGPHEVILVDDGSADGTAGLVEGGFPWVKVLRCDANRGKGAAVRAGMLAAKGAYRVFIDADLPYDLEVLPKMLDYLRVKEFDVCIGSRSKEAGNALKRRPLRRLASGVYTFFISRLVVTGVRDTQCGVKGFRARAAEYLFSESTVDGFAFDVEILYLAFKNDMDIKRMPVLLVSDDNSTVSVIRHGLRMLWDVLMLPVRYYGHRYRMLGDVPREARE